MRQSLMTAVTVLACVVLSSEPARAVEATGPHEISGVISDDNGKPLKGVCVTISPSGAPQQTATTLNDGSYLLSNVPQGSWMTFAWDCRAGKFAPVTFRNVRGLEADVPPAEYVNSIPDGPNIDVNFTLNQGGAITVKATDSAGNGLAGATVCPFFADLNANGHLVGSGVCATANAKGVATIKGIQPGSTKLQITASGHPTFWYYGSDFSTATRVPVVAGKTARLGNVDLDADLSGTGTISGKITGVGGIVLAKACATVFTSSTIIGAFTSPTDGSYTITGVPAGFWEVVGTDCSDDLSQIKYAPTVYKNNQGTLDADNADNVLVVDGAVVTGINMSLARAGTIRVHVTDSSTGDPINVHDGGGNACPWAPKLNQFGHQFQSSFCTDDGGTPGTVLLTGVPTGKNKVSVFVPGYDSDCYRYFGGTCDFASAALVNVTAGGVIDITIPLDPTGP